MRPAATPLLLTGAVFLVAFLGFVLGAACLPRLPPPLASRLQGGDAVAAAEEKVRLGSSPPNCRGKCYECSPCTAVQVPTLSGPSVPAAAAVAAAGLRPRARAEVPLVALSTSSNYKPVGWKCQCRDRRYMP